MRAYAAPIRPPIYTASREKPTRITGAAVREAGNRINLKISGNARYGCLKAASRAASRAASSPRTPTAPRNRATPQRPTETPALKTLQGISSSKKDYKKRFICF